MLEPGFIEFNLDYQKTENLAVDDAVLSDDFTAGGHVWRICCYPRNKADNDYLSLYPELVSPSKNVRAILEAFLMGRDGSPPSSHAERCVQVYPLFVKRTILAWDYVTDDGRVTFVCGVVVLRGRDNPISVPPSDVGNHLGRLLACAAGSDVSFSVGGETFPAHRAVLAARSPVFRAQLLGSMADAKLSCVMLHGIEPETFRTLLRFMYTDALPGEDEEVGSSSSASFELWRDLLVAADMYDLDRLKLMSAQKLCEHVSTTDSVATILCCAERHNCPELKNRCIDFFIVEKNFMKAVLTEGYLQLLQNSPAVINEIRARLGINHV